MSSAPELRWELLPHDPQAFFRLSDGYDLKDLKRSYNAHIRRFKPEKYPAEFQRIRDAYEELNNALRYGEILKPRSIAAPRCDWIGTSGSQQLHGYQNLEAIESNFVSGAELLKSLDTKAQKRLYDELRTRDPKSPKDYYSLAVLSDFIEPTSFSFVGWLLAGLEKYPHEPALFLLLRERFQSDSPNVDLRELLISTVKVVHNDRFYYLTERVWDRLLRLVAFAPFRKTLEVCESQLRDCQVRHQMTFYVHILKTAMFRADAEWIAEMYRRLEECHDQLSPSARSELDILDFYKTYLDRRAEFLESGGPMRTLIDRVIVNHCTLDTAEADVDFLDCQTKIAECSRQLMAEFDPPGFKEEYVIPVWNHIAADVVARSGKRVRRNRKKGFDRSVRQLTLRLIQASDNARLQSNRFNFKIFIGWGGLFALVASFAYFGYQVIANLFFRSAWLWAVGDLCALGIAIIATLVWFVAITGSELWLCTPVYRHHWRRELEHYFRRYSYPIEDVANYLESMKDTKVKGRIVDGAEEIAVYLRSDTAMCVYATAHRVLREIA